MPTHNFALPRGRLEHFELSSPALADNRLGDPHRRAVAVYLPEGYDHDHARRYPLFVALAPFTGSGLKLTAWQAFGESLPQRIDRLVAAGDMGPVVLAMPDAFTSLGGNQYLDSAVFGDWASFLATELIVALEGRYRLLPGAAHRAIFGKSSGGYGALIQGMTRPGTWGAVASHAGDAGFELLYLSQFPRVLDALARRAEAPVDFVRRCAGLQRLGGEDFHVLMMLAMAASYDPDPDPEVPLGLRLPVDTLTCELIPERWARWLAHDPVRLAGDPQCCAALAGLRALHIDVGDRDDYHIHYGTRALVRRLEGAGVPLRHEEFSGGHSGIDHRYDRSLPHLYAAVA